ncbi:MAG: histidine kinase [Rhodocyclaceae bacterium]|nr:histidine kinase [Rhodocyclaceae bacterium]MBX3668097.1 histidine kinase [Rhodocyclaceae bacterium]
MLLQLPVIIGAAFVYLAVLFAIAYYGDKRADAGRSIISHPLVYSLSLGVYCTTWTFYGSVGRAAASGIGFLPVYLGPTLVAALWGTIMLKMLRVSKTYRITSIADLIGSRYGKSQLLAGLVSLIAVIGVVPYIALQLKAIANSFSILTAYPETLARAEPASGMIFTDSGFLITLMLAAFTIVFGTRHLDATERHEGMVAAVAFESVVKLVAFSAVGVFVTWGIYDGFDDIFRRASEVPALFALMTSRDTAATYGSWTALTLLSMSAVMFLPRQFQITVVENVDENHLRRAIWMFPAYLLAINIFVLPIAFGGLIEFGKQGTDTDMFVLTLPMSRDQQWLALLAFVGGLSAGTGMIIVETIALSTMVCNDLVMPLLLRLRMQALERRSDLTWLLLGIRRFSIVSILLLGYLYFRLAGEAYALVSIGLISFSAVAQFAPAIIGGLYWKGATRRGAVAGLMAGFIVWTYTLLLPSFARSGWLPQEFLTQGVFGIELLRPQQLFGLAGLDAITHALFWSMACNIGALIGFSLLGREDAREATQAELFVDVFKHGSGVAGPSFWRGSAQVGDLITLVGRFLGVERARRAFERYAARRGNIGVDQLRADADLVHFTETQLAGAIGSASARVMVASVVKEEALGLDEVMNILDEASQVRAYSQQLEQKSRELEQATTELRAANERLTDLDRLKDDFMSSVTHELRTPLTSIRAFSEILVDNPEMEEDQRQEFLSIITKETVRLTRLVNQVLDMAKLESGRTDWRDERTDLREVIEQAVAATSQLFKDRGAAIELVLPDELPGVMIDGDRFVQVLVNLLGNAVKFVNPGSGHVKVSLTRDDADIVVEVADNGPGILAEDQPKIFEKFRQGGDSLTGKPQGTGLGLPISRQIVEHYGGRLWVESAPEREPGARFIFRLPSSLIALEEEAA